MKPLRLLTYLLLVLGIAFAALPTARAQEEGSFDYFYDNLSPYGEWVEVADYGLCWKPKDVDADWAPYTDGYWAYTDAGWTWVSYEDFGSIVYHYGRWVRVDEEGWCWVPDNDWGPAWVSWRNNDDYIGWAPLPPEAHFDTSVGFSTWVDDTYDIGPDNYHFCHVRDFSAPVIREVCLPRARNVVFVRETVNITNITINNGYGGPFCGGPRYDFVSRRAFRPIPALKLVRETNIANININIRDGDRRRGIATVQRGNTLLMPAPRLRPIGDRRMPLPNISPVRTFAADHVNRGWGKDRPQAERDQYRQLIKEQSKGATAKTAPARAITAADVKEVPTKADPDAPSPVVTGKNRGPGNGAGRGLGARTPGVEGAHSEGERPRQTGQGREGMRPGTNGLVDGDNNPGDRRGPGKGTGLGKADAVEPESQPVSGRGGAKGGLKVPGGTDPTQPAGKRNPGVAETGQGKGKGKVLPPPGETIRQVDPTPNDDRDRPVITRPVTTDTPRRLVAPRSPVQPFRSGETAAEGDRTPGAGENLRREGEGTNSRPGLGAGAAGERRRGLENVPNSRGGESPIQSGTLQRRKEAELDRPVVPRQKILGSDQDEGTGRQQQAAAEARQRAMAQARERAAAGAGQEERQQAAAAAQARQRAAAANENRERNAGLAAQQERAAAAQQQQRAAAQQQQQQQQRAAAAAAQQRAAGAEARERAGMANMARERAAEAQRQQVQAQAQQQQQRAAAAAGNASGEGRKGKGKKDDNDR